MGAHPWIAIGLREDVNIEVMETGDKGLSSADAWAQLVEKTGTEPRMIIMDYENKLYFIYKCYDNLGVKAKMTLAAAKTQCRNMFDGIAKDIDIREESEFNEAYFEDRRYVIFLTTVIVLSSYEELTL